MRIARVIGQLTMNDSHDSFHGGSLKLVVPLLLDQLNNEAADVQGDELLAAWDQFGSGTGSLVAISEGPEASRPFRPDLKPVDTYIAAILDDVHLNKT